MRYAFVLESFEARTLLSAAVAKTVGESAGLRPQDNPTAPKFIDAVGTVHNAEDGNTGIDLDSSLKVHVLNYDFGTIDNTHLMRNSVLIKNLDAGTTLKSSDFLSKVITTGGGDAVIIAFKTLLPRNTHFSVELNYTGDPTYGNVPSGSKIRASTDTSTTYYADTTFNFSTGTYFAQSSLTSKFSVPQTLTQSQAASGDHGFTSVTMGPDGKLYASDSQGYIYAYTLNSDGTLGASTTINSIREHFGTNGVAVNRLITGIAFKPNSTATSMELWVSSGQYRFGNSPGGSDDTQKSADNFTGEVDGLSGDGLTKVEPLVIHIPRSTKDHMNNQIVFSPNSKSAFFGLAGMNAMGSADPTWGNRVENIYTAAIFSLKVGGENGIYNYINKVHGGPVDLLIDGTDTGTATGLVAGSTHYNVYKGSNPLRIYADGIRNDFDMVYDTDGHLYAGINGSSAGGNVPATPADASNVPIANRPDKDAKDSSGNYIYHTDPKDPTSPLKPYAGPSSPALTAVTTVEEDTLLDVKNGAYYGHPNPARGEYIFDGANPTSGTDSYEIKGNGTNGYSDGQPTDRSYTKPIYDFGQNYSPDGMFQYKSVNGLNTDLDGYILVCRYSSGGDILAIKPVDGKLDTTNNVQARIQGLTDLGTPLDVTEDTNTGNLYVAVLSDETGHGYLQLITPTNTAASVKKKSVAAASLVASTTPAKASAATSAFSSKSLVDDLDLNA